MILFHALQLTLFRASCRDCTLLFFRQDTLQVYLLMLYLLHGPEPEARIELCLRIDLEFQSYRQNFT
ncbi:hypothetical protein M6B38_402645 [Iris pallida]|uniref:Uncharacterized protein n=1 Tax=Iris pallida TaxID=29817 RepID=A0AAX6FSB9_IRIPA|nr:hypothetical protein M6B38_402645 [Iris pallida]